MLGQDVLLDAVAVLLSEVGPPDPAAHGLGVSNVLFCESQGLDHVRKLAAELVL